MLSLLEISQHYGVTYQAVRLWFASGEIPTVKRKGANNKPTRYAKLEDVKAWLKAHPFNRRVTP